MKLTTDNNLSVEIVAEQEAQHRAELRRLNDIAFCFLYATNGNAEEAEKLLDDAISAMADIWRYRIVLDRIREGL